MIHGAAVRVVSVHVAERNAVIQRSERIACCVEPLTFEALQNLFCETNTSSASASYIGSRDGRIKAAWPEEVHEGGINIGLTVVRIDSTAAYSKWTCGRLASA